MRKIYDAIVIGAGNGGLVSACILQQNGKDVLLLEQNNVPGGVATSFVRGRFEFEASLHELCNYGTNVDPSGLKTLFKQIGIDDELHFVDVPEAFRVISVNGENKKDYIMPFGIENFINKMETYVPGSTESVTDFFDLAKECAEAMDYISSTEGHPEVSVLKTKYANFTRVGSYSLQTVLDKLKMPKEAQEILTTYWSYLGSPSKMISFVHYALLMNSYIEKKAQVPYSRSQSISTALARRFQSMGGEVRYNTRVSKIMVENNQVQGIKLENGEEISCKHIICNINPNIVYGSMIEKEKVPKDALRLCNQRQLGGRGFAVYLGLNKSPEELGIENYSYFIYSSLDSNEEYNYMKELNHDSNIAVCLNKAIPTCSPKGTTILYLTSLYCSDAFDKEVNSVNYFNLKDKLANQFIEGFERSTGINIKDYIEEVEVATPVTFARYMNSPQGSIYGYLVNDNDNLMPRLMGMNSEDYIKGLRFCGGSTMRHCGYGSAYFSGLDSAKLTINDIDNKGGM